MAKKKTKTSHLFKKKIKSKSTKVRLEKYQSQTVKRKANNNDLFDELKDVAKKFRDLLKNKKFILVFAHNGTGKTRLSSEFKNIGKGENKRDTLYFNAFTEDLFSWDNDLDGDTIRELKLNTQSIFFKGLDQVDMASKIAEELGKHVDFDFDIHLDESKVTFKRDVIADGKSTSIENIKISRGEENIFIWCFFLAVARLAVEKEEAYKWVKYIYVDDPISSLDDNNSISVASHLSQILLDKDNEIKTVISSHHSLFYNVMWNELNSQRNKVDSYYLSTNGDRQFELRDTGDTPFFHHIALLKKLNEAVNSDILYEHHFNILRNIMEKTASFHGYRHFSQCLGNPKDEVEKNIHKRMINVLSHGNHSLFNTKEMNRQYKSDFKKILSAFMRKYNFNPDLFK